MTEHKSFWVAIDKLAGLCGYSASGLAKKAGLDPTVFNKSKRISAKGRKRWPTTESISKILEVTGFSMGQFVALMDSNYSSNTLTLPKIDEKYIVKKGVLTTEGFMDKDANGKHFNYETFNIRNFILKINSGKLFPSYKKGDLLIITPKVAVDCKDKVVFKHLKLGFYLGELKNKTLQMLTLKYTKINSQNEQEIVTDSFLKKDIEWIFKITWKSE